jgi:hypothetical protein
VDDVAGFLSNARRIWRINVRIELDIVKQFIEGIDKLYKFE